MPIPNTRDQTKSIATPSPRILAFVFLCERAWAVAVRLDGLLVHTVNVSGGTHGIASVGASFRDEADALEYAADLAASPEQWNLASLTERLTAGQEIERQRRAAEDLRVVERFL